MAFIAAMLTAVTMNLVSAADVSAKPMENQSVIAGQAAESDMENGENADEIGIFGTKYRCTGSDVNIRKGPGTDYDIVGKLVKGEYVRVTEISNGWAKLLFDKGYVYAVYLEKV